MADDPHITHNPSTAETHGGSALPSGWILCADTPDGLKAYRRRAVYRGPAPSLDAADTAIRAAYDGGDGAAGALIDLSHSRSPGSGVAEIEATYTTESGTGGGGEGGDEWETVSPDTVTLTPQTVAVALAAHPKFADKTAKILEINDWLAKGNRFNALSCAGADADLLSYIGLYEAGVTTWNTIGYTFTVVRHYAADAAASEILAGYIENAGKVVAWSGVEGHDSLGVEPKWTDTSASPAAARSFEWLFCGASASVVGDELQITISYQAAWKWASLLYSGGSWNPQPPAAS